MAKSRSLSLVEASASKCGEISTIKCVLLGLLGADRFFSLSTMRRASVSIRLSCKAVTWALKSPGLGLIPQEISQHPVRASVKILAIRDVTGSMLIKEPVHAHRLGGFNDVPEMLLIVQLIEITPDGAALCAGQLHRMDAVDALTKEKTIIMIAHRLKTVRHADQIVVVEKGRIAQHGTYEQLMKQEGIYKRFVDARQQAVSWKLVH